MKPSKVTIELEDEQTFLLMSRLAKGEKVELEDAVEMAGIDPEEFAAFMRETKRQADPNALKVLAAAQKRANRAREVIVGPVDPKVIKDLRVDLSKIGTVAQKRASDLGSNLRLILLASAVGLRVGQILVDVIAETMQRNKNQAVTLEMGKSQVTVQPSQSRTKIKASVDKLLASA